MTIHTLFPSFAKVAYHSAYAPHTQTIPTAQWLATPNVGGAGAYPQWDTGTIDAKAMWDAYVALLQNVLPDTVTVDDILIYNMPEETSDPQPVAALSYGVPGLDTGNGTPAAEATFSFRSTDFGLFKLVLLDITPSENFVPLKYPALSLANRNLIDFIMDEDNAISARDNTRPFQFINCTYGINDALHRKYFFG